MLEKIKNNKKSIFISLLPILLILIITIKILTNQELILDELGYNLIVEQLRHPTLTKIMTFITRLGDTITMIIITIILTLFLIFKWKKSNLAKIIPTSLLIITLSNQLLKNIFKRPRPAGYRLINIDGYSFPSGHSVACMAFYGLLIYIIYHTVKNKKIRNMLITINSTLIILIGFSRVYLGVHYLSDVIVGYSLSIIYINIIIKLINKYKIFP